MVVSAPFRTPHAMPMPMPTRNAITIAVVLEHPVQVAEHRSRRVGRQAEHGADRQVDVPGDDDHRLAEREEREDRPVAEDDVDLRAAEEPRLHRGRDDDQQDESGDDPVGAQAEDEIGQPRAPSCRVTPASALGAVDGRHQAASCSS